MTSCCAYANLSRFKLFLMELLAFGKELLPLVFQLRKTNVTKENCFIIKVPNRIVGIRDFPYLMLGIGLPYLRLGIQDFPYLTLAIRDFPYLRLWIRDFTAKSERDSGLKVCATVGYATHSHWDYGIERNFGSALRD